MVKFSVVIALYNKQQYIVQTIKSVLAQSFCDFEIIVINDGSTDGSARQVAEIDDKRIKLVSQPNAGVSAARNRGIQEASGDWVAFLDADDLWADNYLAVVNTLIEMSNTSINAIATGFHAGKSVAEFETIEARPGCRDDIDLISDLPHEWMQRTLFFTSSISIKRTLLQSMQPCFSVGESNGEDVEFWLKVSATTSILYTKMQLAFYRENAVNSLAANNSRVKPAPYLERLLIAPSDVAYSPSLRRSLRTFVAHQVVTVARENIVRNKRKDAFQLLVSTLPEGVKLVRWWATVFMLGVPRHAVYRWQSWRVRRMICQ